MFRRTALTLWMLAACTDPKASGSASGSSVRADAGMLAEFQPESIAWPDDGDEAAPFMLSSVGLYRDIASKELRPDLHPYEPRYALWSDGADKKRWLYLPPSAAIDTADPDHWQFPVG